MAGAEGHLMGTLKQTLTENAGADPAQLALIIAVNLADSKRIENLRARETTGVLRGPDATQSAYGRL